MRLGTKISLGLIFAGFLSLGASAFCLMRFHSLEQRMRLINEGSVPLVKILNQIEGHIYLFDFELDRSLQNKNEPVRWGQIDAILQKTQSALVLIKENSGESAADFLVNLQQSSTQLRDLLNKSGVERPTDFDPRVSALRADIRHNLRMSIREADREMRLAAIEVQTQINKSGIIVTLLIGLSSMLFIALVAWLNYSLQPLTKLKEIMQKISRDGIDAGFEVNLRTGRDEVAVLASEFQKMALSLRDRKNQLELQRQNIELANIEMANQNKILKKTQAQLVQQERLALVGRFSAQLAHEIKNPLNAMGLHLDYLEGRLADHENVEVVKAIRQEIFRLLDITESQLAQTKFPQLQKADADLNELVRECSTVYSALLNELGIKLELKLSALPKLSVDANQLKLVMGNLIKNAAESMADKKSDGLRRICFSSRYDSGGNFVELACEDSGHGMNEMQAKELFTPFFTTKPNGTGLGLSHSRQIIEAHGGEMFFSSKLNRGTIFSFKLPAEQG